MRRLLTLLPLGLVLACNGGGGDGPDYTPEPALDGGPTDPDAGPAPDRGVGDDSGAVWDGGPAEDGAAGGDGAVGDAGGADLDGGVEQDGGPAATLSAHPVRLALPAEAPFMLGHPMIFDGRLYVRTTTTPAMLPGPQVISCYDLRHDNALLWSTNLGDDLFAVYPRGDTMKGVALIRTDDFLPVIARDLERGFRFHQVDAITGELRWAVGVPDEWEYLCPNGRWCTKSVLDPTGSPVEWGDDLYFGDGTMLDKCGGGIRWSNSAWRATANDPVIARNLLYGYKPGNSAHVRAFDLVTARDELMGYLERGTTVRFETEQGDSRVAAHSLDLLIHRGLVVKLRLRTLAEDGVEDGYYVERWDAVDGHFVDRIRVPLQSTPDFAQDDWHPVYVAGYPVVSGDTLLLPMLSGALGTLKAGVIHAFDLAAARPAWRATWPADASPAGLHTTVVPSRDHVYALERHQLPSSPHTDLGFRVHRFDLADGRRSAIFRDDITWNEAGGAVGAAAFDSPDGDAMSMEAQPLLFEGKLYVPTTGPAGTVFWILDVGDETANVLQYKLNNQLNAVQNLGAPTSNQAEDPLPPVIVTPEDTSVADLAPLGPTGDDESFDTPPTAEPFAPALDALGLDVAQAAALPRAYVASLATVEFSQSGEEDAGNLGEGYLKPRSDFGCGKTALRYPRRGFLALQRGAALPGQPPGPEHLRFAPDLPVFYRPEPYLSGVGTTLTLGWSSLEDDDRDGLDRVFALVGQILGMVRSYLSGDYCGLASQMASMAAAEANDYTEPFGSPSLALFNGAGLAEPNLYGVPFEAWSADFDLASSATRDPLVAASEAIGAACSIGSLAESPSVAGLDNAVGTTLDLFDPADRSTRGTFHIRRARFVKIREITVEIDRIDLEGDSPTGIVSARVGLLGEDGLSSVPEGVVSPAETPFRSLAERRDLPITFGQDLDLQVFRATPRAGDDTSGTLGVYVELGLTTLSALAPGRVTFSETRFLDDLLQGAFEATEHTDDRFHKTVRKRLDTPTLQGYVTLTYRVRTP